MRCDGDAARIILESFGVYKEFAEGEDMPAFMQAIGSTDRDGIRTAPDAAAANTGRLLVDEYVEVNAIRLTEDGIWCFIRHEITGVPEPNTGWVRAEWLRTLQRVLQVRRQIPTLSARGAALRGRERRSTWPTYDSFLNSMFFAEFTETDGGIGRTKGHGGWTGYVLFDDVVWPEIGSASSKAADIPSRRPRAGRPRLTSTAARPGRRAGAGTAYLRISELTPEEFESYRQQYILNTPANSGVSEPAWIERGSYEAASGGGVVWEAAWHDDAENPAREAELRAMFESVTAYG